MDRPGVSEYASDCRTCGEAEGQQDDWNERAPAVNCERAGLMKQSAPLVLAECGELGKCAGRKKRQAEIKGVASQKPHDPKAEGRTEKR